MPDALVVARHLEVFVLDMVDAIRGTSLSRPKANQLQSDIKALVRFETRRLLSYSAGEVEGISRATGVSAEIASRVLSAGGGVVFSTAEEHNAIWNAKPDISCYREPPKSS